jgi:Domain of unknown function (DUF1918)
MVEMKALPGDRLVIRGHRVGEHVRDGEILEVLGEAGWPPYVVRWSDDDPRAGSSRGPTPTSTLRSSTGPEPRGSCATRTKTTKKE